jgi:hypothetical protein
MLNSNNNIGNNNNFLKKTFKKSVTRFSRKLKKTKKYQLTKSIKLKKQIYIYSANGFGNKIFSLIIAIYLYNYYQGRCDINYVINRSTHENINDPDIMDIFPKSAEKINYIFVHENSFRKFKIKSNMKSLIYLSSIKGFPTYEKLPNYYYVDTIYNLVYQMYKTFDQSDKDIFKIDTDLITDKKILSLSKENYSIVHIRYGDKIHITNKYLKTPKFDKFLIYTPEYYIDMINMLLKTKNKVIILSDSFEIINEYILKNNDLSNNPNIILLNANWLDSFYLFYNARNVVMSCSTFSMAGCFFNSNPKSKCYLNLYHDDMKKKIIPEEFSTSPDWIITHKKKYILNYNVDLLNNILEYCTVNNLKCGTQY